MLGRRPGREALHFAHRLWSPVPLRLRQEEAGTPSLTLIHHITVQVLIVPSHQTEGWPTAVISFAFMDCPLCNVRMVRHRNTAALTPLQCWSFFDACEIRLHARRTIPRSISSSNRCSSWRSTSPRPGLSGLQSKVRSPPILSCHASEVTTHRGRFLAAFVLAIGMKKDDALVSPHSPYFNNPEKYLPSPACVRVLSEKLSACGGGGSGSLRTRLRSTCATAAGRPTLAAKRSAPTWVDPLVPVLKVPSSPPPISFLPVHPLTTTARLAQEGLSTRRNWCAARAATRPDKRARSTAKSTWRWVASRSAKCPGLDSVVTYRRLLSSAAVEVPFLLPARDVLLCGQGPLLRPLPRRTRYQHLHPFLREPHGAPPLLTPVLPPRAAERVDFNEWKTVPEYLKKAPKCSGTPT